MHDFQSSAVCSIFAAMFHFILFSAWPASCASPVESMDWTSPQARDDVFSY